MIFKFKFIAIITIILAMVSSCNKEPKYKQISNGATKSGVYSNESSTQSYSNESLSNELHTVVAKEVLQATKYVYIRVEEDGETFWIASRKQDINIGETYFYKRSLLKTNFESKEHNKLFEKIYLVSNLVRAHDHGKGQENIVNSNSQNEKVNTSETSLPNTNDKSNIEQKGSIKIAELVKNPKKYEGKTVQISGKCVKINSNIMDRNWIHIKDGSKDDYDLVITSDTFVAEGSNITMKAMVTLNKDFGAGYYYDLILENGIIVK